MTKLVEPVKPQGLLGLNSVVVLGENVQVAMPLNHQLAVGSNIQLCVNPAGLAAGVPGYGGSDATGFLGGGLGGNLQLTIGTSANVVLGRSMDINMGPAKFSLDVSDPPSLLACGIVGALSILWPIIYALDDDDTHRAHLVIGFQAAIDVFLAATIGVALDTTKIKTDIDKERAKLYGDRYVEETSWDPPGGPKMIYEGLLTLAAIVGVAILPEVLIATNENFKVS